MVGLGLLPELRALQSRLRAANSSSVMNLAVNDAHRAAAEALPNLGYPRDYCVSSCPPVKDRSNGSLPMAHWQYTHRPYRGDGGIFGDSGDYLGR